MGIDTFDLPVQDTTSSPNVDYFYANQYTGVTTGWQIWSKPPGKSNLWIMCIGGGGGGAGGSSSTNVGGGGGGSSGISRYLYSMWALPDNLYVLVGAGGIGGAINDAGGNGQLSYVSLYPDSAANNLFAVSGAAAALGAVGAGAATGGVAGTIGTDAGAVFSCWAIAKYIAGQAGTAGGSNTSAGGGSVGTGVMLTGGTGGGGNSISTGGGYFAVANTPFITWSAGTTAGGAGFGHAPFPLFYGGFGGAASIPGGNGTMGTGGGGGQGASAGPGTAGGRGGDGLVMMVSF